MDLREFLLHKTNVGDIVVIQDAGWQTGLTMILLTVWIRLCFVGK